MKHSIALKKCQQRSVFKPTLVTNKRFDILGAERWSSRPARRHQPV